MDSYVAGFLAEHAISEEIGGRGRYVHFERGDLDLVASFFAPFGSKLERFARNVAGQQGGVVIRRVGWGMEIPPQLRPDSPVYGLEAPTLSFHPDDISVKGRYHTTSKGARVWIRALPEKLRDRHIAKWHPDGNEQGVHLHRPSAKYAIPPGAHGKRLDVPFPDRILHADRVFFVIEGSVKTDAVLSTGEAAFGVPSVTLWDAPELDDFLVAMNLRSKQLVIVPDADWVDNPLVITQAMLLRTYLRERGIDAVVAAPPLNHGAVEWKGVDDFLASGRSIEELSVLEREAVDSLPLWALLFNSGFRQVTQAIHGVNFVGKLALYADEQGQLVKSIAAFARILGRDRKAVRRTLEDLERAGVIEVEGSLDADFQYEDELAGTWHNYDWNERPRITIVPKFRATTRTMPLCDLPIVRERRTEAMSLGESRTS